MPFWQRATDSPVRPLSSQWMSGGTFGASGRPDSESELPVTAEDCLLFDIHCPDATRLEQIVGSLARHGPVTTSLVLRRYPPKPLVTAM